MKVTPHKFEALGHRLLDTLHERGKDGPLEYLKHFKKSCGREEGGLLTFWRGFGEGAMPAAACNRAETMPEGQRTTSLMAIEFLNLL